MLALSSYQIREISERVVEVKMGRGATYSHIFVGTVISQNFRHTETLVASYHRVSGLVQISVSVNAAVIAQRCFSPFRCLFNFKTPKIKLHRKFVTITAIPKRNKILAERLRGRGKQRRKGMGGEALIEMENLRIPQSVTEPWNPLQTLFSPFLPLSL